MGIRFSWVALTFAVVGGAVLACGSSVDSEFPGPTPDPTTDPGSSGGPGDGFGSSGTPVNPTDPPIVVDPPTATLTITNRGAALSQTFTAKTTGASPTNVTASWTLDKYEAGQIDAKGSFTTNGMVGGKAKVTAHYKKRTATADMKVLVKITEDLPAAATPANKAALLGAPTPDPGGANATQILYPYDGTVMPRGLSSPLFQLTPGSVPPEDAKITLSCSTFSWTGIGNIPDKTIPQLSVPQDVWDAFTQSCGGEEATISIAKAASGVAYGPYTTKMVIAAATLKGAVFYQSYEGANLGLWSVRPGVKEPAKHLKTDCVVCHSVSANGETLTTGMDAAGAQSGAYTANPDGTIKQISKSPALTGDSRGLSFAWLTPDGKYVLRSSSDFWGGVATKAFKVDKSGDANTVMPEATVTGLSDVQAYLPIFSPDGKRIAFINGDGTTMGTARTSVSFMDAVVNPAAGANGSLTFTNRTVALDNGKAGGSGLITKFPAFLPDSKQVVLQEGTNGTQGYGGMLASYYDTNTGKLFLLRNGEHIELTKANTGVRVQDYNQNFEPTALPVTAGGYFWMVFTSQRQYGNTFTGLKKQLWVAAISPSSPTGLDPSHPPFFLPNQSVSENERGFWALEPCRKDGIACGSGDECCDGFCRPEDENNPASKKVCKPPVVGQCSQIAEKCTTTADCCGAPAIQCIGGFCTEPPPR
jgi:WD40-like Beta Propeller Repeat